MPKRIFIAFGANLGDRKATAERALEAIALEIGPIIQTSELIESAALLLPDQTPGSQPTYLNAVWLVETELSAEECLAKLLTIERRFGRIRSGRWESRTIDLDIIAYGSDRIETANLIVPHPEMHKRDFVLIPMSQIDPDWIHPVLSRSINDLLAELG